uniref:Uncharacterized protein n=1 Tax=Glossina austeni TaxID=7395 RepID=A0A1A9UVR4_GLOAU
MRGFPLIPSSISCSNHKSEACSKLFLLVCGNVTIVWLRSCRLHKSRFCAFVNSSTNYNNLHLTNNEAMNERTDRFTEFSFMFIAGVFLIVVVIIVVYVKTAPSCLKKIHNEFFIT